MSSAPASDEIPDDIFGPPAPEPPSAPPLPSAKSASEAAPSEAPAPASPTDKPRRGRPPGVKDTAPRKTRKRISSAAAPPPAGAPPPPPSSPFAGAVPGQDKTAPPPGAQPVAPLTAEELGPFAVATAERLYVGLLSLKLDSDIAARHGELSKEERATFDSLTVAWLKTTSTTLTPGEFLAMAVALHIATHTHAGFQEQKARRAKNVTP